MIDDLNSEARKAVALASIEALPFVRDPTPDELAAGQKGRIFWTAQPSGNWLSDCNEGEAWARALLDHMAEHRDRYLLGWVVRDMERGPHLSGQAVGFLAVFADMARFANMLATGKAEALLAEAKEAKGQAA